VREENIIPVQVLAEAGTTDPVELTRLGIEAAGREHWKAALVLLAEAYRLFSMEPELKDGMIKIETDAAEPIARRQTLVRMFSYYGLALAMSNNSRAAEGARFCEIAIQKEPYQTEHYLALARIWEAARNRQKTVQAVDRGLKELPRSQALLEMRGAIGWREKNAVRFLPREHPLNVALGKMLRKKRNRTKGAGRTSPPSPAKPDPKR
jgi:hypothetical protein